MDIKVYYEDTDAGGVVYHASYIRFFERGRTEFFSSIGHDPAGYHESGEYFVVSRVEIDYRKTAKLGDILTIESGIHELRGASVTIRQKCLRQSVLVADALVTVAFIDKNGKPRRLPKGLVKALAAL